VENLRKWYDSLGGDGCSEVQVTASVHAASCGENAADLSFSARRR
jgi:hypothetical protein